MSDLLPPNATPEERALSKATARIGLPDTALGIDTLWRPWDCPEELLPWLAWALAVDVWDAGWDVATKRRVIAASIPLRRRAGTVWAVMEALKAAGYADALLTEGSSGHWAEFDLEVDLGETEGVATASRATLLRLLYNSKPASRHLRTIRHTATVEDEVGITDGYSITAIMETFDNALFVARHDGRHRRDGSLRYDGGNPGDMDRLDFSLAFAAILDDFEPTLADSCAFTLTQLAWHDGRHRRDGSLRYDGALRLNLSADDGEKNEGK
jgi:phage tail P2-like protein